jgi:hypothetical protein
VKYFKFIINDDNWNIYLTDADNIRELFTEHDAEYSEDASGAFIDTDKKEAYFNEAEFSKEVVIHEMIHMSFYYLYLGDVEFDSSELEELMADFWSKRLDWFNQKTDQLYKQLLALKDSKDENA